MSVSVRPAEEADRASIFELFSIAFGSQADPAAWAWKYDRNPNRATCAVAVADGRVVGYYGGFGTRYRGAEGDFPGVAASDVMTDPRARTLGRRTLFATLVEGFCRLCTEAGMPFGFGFPNERHRLAGEKTIGYRPVESVTEWVRPVAIPSLLGRLRRRLLHVRVVEGFSRAHDALAEVLHARDGWRTDRSRETLTWRFAARPDVKYVIYEIADARARSRAYAVVRVVGERVLLVDLQALDETSGAVADLLDAVASDRAYTSARTLELRAGSRSILAARAGKELGFSPRTSDTMFEVRLFDPKFDLERASQAFDYRFGDHEIF